MRCRNCRFWGRARETSQVGQCTFIPLRSPGGSTPPGRASITVGQAFAVPAILKPIHLETAADFGCTSFEATPTGGPNGD